MTDTAILLNLLNQWKKVDPCDHDDDRKEIETAILEASSDIDHEVTSVLYGGFALSDQQFEQLSKGETVQLTPVGGLVVWTKSYKVGEARARNLAEVHGYNSVMLAYVPSVLEVVVDIEQLNWAAGIDSFKNQDVFCKNQELVLNSFNTNLFNYADFL